WHIFRTTVFERQGVRLADLTPAQRSAVTALLTTALSRDGDRKVTEIMHGDEVLKMGARRGGPLFGEDQYYLPFVGTPSTPAPWMLQFGGHHLAINLTMAGGQASMAPSLPTPTPAGVTSAC